MEDCQEHEAAFSRLKGAVCDPTLDAIRDMGFTHATDTFMFEAETGKIDKQMVVVQTAPKMEAAAKVRYTHSWLLMLNECVVLPCKPVTICSSDVMCLGAGISGPRCGRMGQSLRGLRSTGRGKDLA